MNKVYIILINYKRHTDTIECLESILKSGYSNFQVFVVDNSPDDTSVTQLLNWMNNGRENIETAYSQLVYPLVSKPVSHTFITEKDLSEGAATISDEKVILVKTTNRGFAAANNLALKHIMHTGAEDSLIWILNNDTVIAKDSLEQLVVFSNAKGPRVVVGSKLMFYYKPNILQAVAGRYNRWMGSTYHVGEGEVDNGQYDSFTFGDDNYIVGASIFMHRQFLDEVGLMDENYFLYYEELDWFLRAKNYAYSCALQPNAVVYHKEGTSIIDKSGQKKDTSLAEYYSIINRVKFTKQWYKWCLPSVLAGVVFALVKRILRGNTALVKKASIGVFNVLFTKKQSRFNS